jgi:hypothetical protein
MPAAALAGHGLPWVDIRGGDDVSRLAQALRAAR